MDNERIQRLHKFMKDFKMFLRDNYYNIENKDIQWYLRGLVQFNVNELKERIMDYKKMYKESLERAKKLKETCESTAVVGWCEYIFPALKESEDDKIRKELVFYLGDMPEDTELRNGVTNRDVLAWLEKQGKSNFEQSIQEGDKIVTNEDGTHFNISQLERVAKKENLAWSKEDENILEAITYTVKNSGYSHCIGVSNETMIEWLKSLKERIKPQWKPSEEQMQVLKVVKDYVVSNNWNDYTCNTLKNLLEQLKKL